MAKKWTNAIVQLNCSLGETVLGSGIMEVKDINDCRVFLTGELTSDGENTQFNKNIVLSLTDAMKSAIVNKINGLL